MTRWLAILGLVLTVIPSARASEPLSLGSGTACVLMSEAEAKRELGVRKRHVLACADKTGKVVRVLVTRKGKVDCVDGVQVQASGSGQVIGRACGGVRVNAQRTVPPVLNLSGLWLTQTAYGPCNTEVVQNGTAIAITANCSIGRFSGTGTIDFDGRTFDSVGSADVPLYGRCTGRMSGTITPDAQHTSGTLSCDGLSQSFTSDRTPDPPSP